MQYPIFIKAQAKHNGLTITLISILALIIVIGLLSVFSISHVIVSYFMIAACLLGILIGIFKIKEPAYSFEIDQQGMVYNHRKGQWRINWEDIQRCDVLTTQHGLERIELPYVGISLKHLVPLLDTISLRLASHLLNEQRNLLMMALKDDFSHGECADGSCPSEAMFDTRDVKLNGKVYKGLLGMFANRMQTLRSKLGFELYIPLDALDRDADQFVQLIRQHQSGAKAWLEKTQ